MMSAVFDETVKHKQFTSAGGFYPSANDCAEKCMAEYRGDTGNEDIEVHDLPPRVQGDPASEAAQLVAEVYPYVRPLILPPSPISMDAPAEYDLSLSLDFLFRGDDISETARDDGMQSAGVVTDSSWYYSENTPTPRHERSTSGTPVAMGEFGRSSTGSDFDADLVS